MHRQRACRLLLQAACWAASGLPAAGWTQVVISPVVVEMPARQRSVAVTVSLSAAATQPVRLQAELLRWTQAADGQPVLSPTDELMITPPIAELRPGTRQVFRMALRGPRSSPDELAYRLVLEDISEPTPVNVDSAGSISFRMRYDLPVMLAPAGPVTDALEWAPCATPFAVSPATPPQACVRLLNAGNRRVKVQALTLQGEGWQQVMTLPDGGVNVLAGAEREWHVPLSPAIAGNATSLLGVVVTAAAQPAPKLLTAQAQGALHTASTQARPRPVAAAVGP